MAEDSTIVKDDSRVGGVSLRGIIAIVLVFTVCLLAGFGVEVKEPLYSLSTLATGFYFGQKTPKTT